ncbi:MAG: carotenoid oxygenase family protein [Hyphomonadaceae bacterium]|nr:carotenoid oxygenase family protein [Hyphomonadaceae bacterium]
MDFTRRHFMETGIGLGVAGSVLSAGTAAASPAKTPAWHLGYQNAPINGFEAAEMQLAYGQPPADLNGALFRNGPAQFQYGDQYASHWFDGDGLVHRIAIDDGKAVHKARFVETKKRREELAANAFLAPGFGTLGDERFSVEGPDDVNAANTSVLMINGELHALWEAGSAFAMNADTLETKGPKTWRDDLKGMPFLAHPKVEPDGRIWNLAVGGSRVGIYRISASGTLEDFGLVDIGRAAYIHDWTMSARHLIILVQPWINENLRPPVVAGFEWQPQHGLQMLIVDKDDFTNQRWAQAPARMFFHTGSAWEEADGTLKFDAVLYKRPVLGVGGGADEIRGEWAGRQSAEDGVLTQIVIPTRGDASLIETGLIGEFPQVDPRFRGKARHLTAMVSGPSQIQPGSTGLAVQDWRSGRSDVFDFGDQRMVEEFLFVPKRGGSSDKDAWLVGTVLNLKAGKSEVCVFDAARVSDGPVCIWQADYSWPLGFHGTWA